MAVVVLLGPSMADEDAVDTSRCTRYPTQHTQRHAVDDIKQQQELTVRSSHSAFSSGSIPADRTRFANTVAWPCSAEMFDPICFWMMVPSENSLSNDASPLAVCSRAC